VTSPSHSQDPGDFGPRPLLFLLSAACVLLAVVPSTRGSRGPNEITLSWPWSHLTGEGFAGSSYTGVPWDELSHPLIAQILFVLNGGGRLVGFLLLGSALLILASRTPPSRSEGRMVTAFFALLLVLTSLPPSILSLVVWGSDNWDSFFFQGTWQFVIVLALLGEHCVLFCAGLRSRFEFGKVARILLLAGLILQLPWLGKILWGAVFHQSALLVALRDSLLWSLPFGWQCLALLFLYRGTPTRGIAVAWSLALLFTPLYWTLVQQVTESSEEGLLTSLLSVRLALQFLFSSSLLLVVFLFGRVAAGLFSDSDGAIRPAQGAM
jgi:hypothetical protein